MPAPDRPVSPPARASPGLTPPACELHPRAAAAGLRNVTLCSPARDDPGTLHGPRGRTDDDVAAAHHADTDRRHLWRSTAALPLGTGPHDGQAEADPRPPPARDE